MLVLPLIAACWILFAPTRRDRDSYEDVLDRFW